LYFLRGHLGESLLRQRHSSHAACQRGTHFLVLHYHVLQSTLACLARSAQSSLLEVMCSTCARAVSVIAQRLQRRAASLRTNTRQGRKRGASGARAAPWIPGCGCKEEQHRRKHAVHCSHWQHVIFCLLYSSLPPIPGQPSAVSLARLLCQRWDFPQG
jgi:hypothetical protein